MDKGEAAIREHLATLVGATVDVRAEHHHVARTQVPTVRRSMRHFGHDLPKKLSVCDPAECGPDFVAVPSHAPIKLAADIMLLEQSIDPETNGRIYQTVAVEAFNAMFGAIFAAGKPTVAAFVAACNAIPTMKPVTWDQQIDPITGKPEPWPPKSWCRGYCRWADGWKAKGILA